MAQNYIRNFITLHQETPEISQKGKTAFGKCIIESKNGSGKVTFSAQNIKSEAPYSAYIISVGDHASVGVEIGKVIPGSKGSCEIKFECDGLNVEQSGIALSEFTIAAIIIKKEDSISTPLIGYLDSELIWRNNFRIHDKLHIKEANPIKETKAELKPETLFVEETEEIAEEFEVVETIKQRQEPEEIKEEPILINEAEKEENNFEENPDVELTEIPDLGQNTQSEQKLKEIAEKINSKLKEINSINIENIVGDSIDIEKIKNQSSGNLTADEINKINLIFHNCPKMRPFKNHDKNVDWVRISPNELSYMPQDLKFFAKDHFTASAYRKFNHIILGKITGDESIALLLGSPDIYGHTNKESSALSGYTDFKCCDCSEIIEGKHGYWLKTFSY